MLDPGPPPSHHLCRQVLLLSLEPRMQTFEEALGDRLEKSIRGTEAEEHPLAVRCEQIFAVGQDPVEAVAATDQVFERWPVDDDYHIVARTPRELVFVLDAAKIAIDHVVVTFPTR
jgi:hypothetical protein